MEKLVDDLLELSRVQTARLKIESKEFLYDDLIHEIADNVQLTATHKIIQKGKTNKKIKGDRERLTQVLMNLLTNAIKYSPKADKVIISTQINNSTIITGVQDFGIGISKEYHNKIFERFFRVNDKDEKTYPGMGIGLFLSHEIISRHSGKLWVESSKGRGSTFYFSLPISNGVKNK